jgi:hypothetical protein
MSKVLALLTLAVLAFSAKTGPAFASPIGQIRVRPYGPVEEYWGPGLRSHPRPPGYLDNGIFGSKPRF